MQLLRRMDKLRRALSGQEQDDEEQGGGGGELNNDQCQKSNVDADGSAIGVLHSTGSTPEKNKNKLDLRHSEKVLNYNKNSQGPPLMFYCNDGTKNCKILPSRAEMDESKLMLSSDIQKRRLAPMPCHDIDYSKG